MPQYMLDHLINMCSLPNSRLIDTSKQYRSVILGLLETGTSVLAAGFLSPVLSHIQILLKQWCREQECWHCAISSTDIYTAEHGVERKLSSVGGNFFPGMFFPAFSQRRLFNDTQSFLPYKEPTNVMHCTNCGFVSSEVVPRVAKSS